MKCNLCGEMSLIQVDKGMWLCYICDNEFEEKKGDVRMNCEKVRLREDILLECPLCEEEVVQCDDCKDSPIINEDWYCYNDGDMHFCQSCWEQTLKKK